jgi:hypothetical protein
MSSTTAVDQFAGRSWSMAAEDLVKPETFTKILYLIDFVSPALVRRSFMLHARWADDQIESLLGRYRARATVLEISIEHNLCMFHETFDHHHRPDAVL